MNLEELAGRKICHNKLGPATIKSLKYKGDNIYDTTVLIEFETGYVYDFSLKAIAAEGSSFRACNGDQEMESMISEIRKASAGKVDRIKVNGDNLDDFGSIAKMDLSDLHTGRKFRDFLSENYRFDESCIREFFTESPLEYAHRSEKYFNAPGGAKVTKNYIYYYFDYYPKVNQRKRELTSNAKFRDILLNNRKAHKNYNGFFITYELARFIASFIMDNLIKDGKVLITCAPRSAAYEKSPVHANILDIMMWQHKGYLKFLFEMNNVELEYKDKVLFRTKSVKSENAVREEDRPTFQDENITIDINRELLDAVKNDEAYKAVIILDDVVTSGNRMIICHDMISSALMGSGKELGCFSLSSTAPPDNSIDDSTSADVDNLF